MRKFPRLLACLITFAAFLIGCGDTDLVRVSGSLRARILNVDAEAFQVTVSLQTAAGFRETSGEVVRPETVLELHALVPGLWNINVATLDSQDSQLRLVTVTGVQIRSGQTTEIIVDLGEPPDQCDPNDQTELCTECNQDGELVASDDDDRCGVIDCSSFEWYQLMGTNTAEAESSCIYGQTRDITDQRCAAPGRCIEPSAELCEASQVEIAAAGLCHTIYDCESGAAELLVSPDGTPCGVERVCESGVCVTVETVDPEIGCSDGTREGFLSLDTYPSIAGCSGGWNIGGITRPDLAPLCEHNSGNHSDNPEGTDCSAADLCAPGWHVCQGKEEVAWHAPDGCADAVAPGTPDKSLFFAVVQNSQENSVCDSSDQGNDVFGCGNLGAALSPEKNCGPLNRVLASMHAGTCGFNEAEPPLGPWQCMGDFDSHLHEGAVVTKSGCASASCSYDGNPVGNSDKGGVLCCREED